ncbi:MAG: hypothetical protein C0469_17710 [Cyanobacteria bacterium DS2.3.42]|nr:hypothetical protein [Cyanobacteria bacterium DS2.3.42]
MIGKLNTKELCAMLLEKRLLKLLVARDLLEKGDDEQAMHFFRSALKDCPLSDKWLVESFVSQLEGLSNVKDTI